ncbi:hypothetical protein AB0436_25665 [Streptomyces sp. NPDC051322]|uniref:hypothetical protein n=1 Tax=Streptomyces sp. NPDC051322 TaxID=3154645 RepID=UPI00344D534A
MCRTIEGCLRYAQHHQAAFRTIVTGGVGFDTQVQALRDAVREELIATIAEGAYGHREIPLLARLALLGWLSGVEGVTLDWLNHPEPARETVRTMLARMLRHTLDTIGELVPECPSPPPSVRAAP